MSRATGTSAPDLLVAAWGWDHPSWVGPFYPEGMPAEWRLAYYANAFRAVVVPAPVLALASPDEVAAWAADARPPFAFAVELGSPFDLADPVSLADLLSRLASLEGRIAALVVDGAGQTPDESLLAGLRSRWPLAWLDPPGAREGRGEGPPGVGVAWRPEGVATGRANTGCLGVLEGRARSPRDLRAVIESFRAWARGCPQAFLCFPGVAGAWREMEQAQVIAALLAD